jgi:hypothetical protein
MAVNNVKSIASSILSIESKAGNNFYSSGSSTNLLFHTAQADAVFITSSIYVLPTLKKVTDEFSSIIKLAGQLDNQNFSECSSSLLIFSVQLRKFLVIFPFHSFW